MHGPRVDLFCRCFTYLRRPPSKWGRQSCCRAPITSSSSTSTWPITPGSAAPFPRGRSGRLDLRHALCDLAPPSPSTSPQVRNLLKFWYLRTTSPRRDWIRCSDFTLEEAFHLPGGNSFGRESHLVLNQSVEMMYWLAGEHDVFASVVPSTTLLFIIGDGARPSAV